MKRLTVSICCVVFMTIFGAANSFAADQFTSLDTELQQVVSDVQQAALSAIKQPEQRHSFYNGDEFSALSERVAVLLEQLSELEGTTDPLKLYPAQDLALQCQQVLESLPEIAPAG